MHMRHEQKQLEVYCEVANLPEGLQDDDEGDRLDQLATIYETAEMRNIWVCMSVLFMLCAVG